MRRRWTPYDWERPLLFWCPACGRAISVLPASLSLADKYCTCCSEPGRRRFVIMEEGVPAPGIRLIFIWEE